MTTEYIHGAEVLNIPGGGQAIRTVSTAVTFIVGTAPAASAGVFPLNEPTLIPGSQRMLADLGATGTLPRALKRIFSYAGAIVIVMRVADSANIETQLSNIIGSAASFTGLYGALACLNKFGLTPKLLLAPGFTEQRPGNAANPVALAMAGIALKLKAMAYIDGPAASLTEAQAWKAELAGSRRLFAFTPKVKIWDSVTSAWVHDVATPSIVGTQVLLDNTLGFHYSPSNKLLTDVGGTSRPIEYRDGDPATESNLLNAANLGTIINYGDGFRSWGNRTLSGEFASSVRIEDAIDESILRAARRFIDRPLGSVLIREIVEDVDAYIQTLNKTGAIVGGKAWIDKDYNSALELANGKLVVSYDREPASPLERLTFRAHREPRYYEVLISDVIANLARMSQASAAA